MRPHKKILLLSASEDRLSVVAFMLNVNGFSVTPALSSDQALELLDAGRYDLLFAVLPFTGIERVMQQGASDTFMRTMILSGKSYDCPPGISAHAALPLNALHAEILERVKVLTAAKRGPKPTMKPPQIVAVMSDTDRRCA
jgi:hypothetical protein